jgi:hypothetical protein
MDNLEVLTSDPSLQSPVAADSKGLIRKYQQNIELSYRKWKNRYKEIEHARRYALGKLNRSTQATSGEQISTQAGRSIKGNIIHATLQGLLPYIYSQNPEIKIRPGANVDPQGPQYRVADLFAETVEIVLNESLKKAGLKRIAKQVLRSCMTSKIGIIKVTYQRDYYKDPLISRQFNDAQDSLARIQEDIRRLQDSGSYEGDKDELVEEITMTMNALSQQVEVMHREGLNLGFVRPEDFRMDTALDTLQDYDAARWIANVTWMTPSDVRERFQLSQEEVDKYTLYRRTASGIPNRLNKDQPYSTSDMEDVNLAIAVWEYWDKTTQTVYTWCDGSDKWCKDPFVPARMGDRFFPYFILGLNWIDGEEWPVSETELLMNLQDEYNTVRTQLAKHRELSAPFFVADASRVNQEDIEIFSNAAIGDIAMINAAGLGVNQVFQPATAPPMNPVVYDTSPIRTDMEWISGLGDAQRGGIMRAKTATEANIQQQGLATRVQEKLDATEDWLRDVSHFAIEILLQEVKPQKAQEIAGPQAFWPLLNKQMLYDSIHVNIVAGSMGMPNENDERMRWIELMPIIMQNIQMVQMMRQSGLPDQFNPYVQLLEETFKRFDERIDIAKFLPPVPEQIQQTVQQNMVMQQMMGQGQQQGMPNAVQQPPPPQGANEVMNAPGNRVMQRSRNQHREPQGEM